MRRIVIDTEICEGNGLCFTIASDLFEDDERGYGRAKGDGSFGDELLGVAENAAMACPVGAISVVEGE